jgi:hypothetical protein
MSKLPTEFVQTTKPKEKKKRQPTIVAPNPREVLMHLSDEELEALETARQALHTPITMEQMIHRVLAEWMMRAKAVAKPVEAAPPAPNDPKLLARLREFAAAPLQTWRAITGNLRMLVHARRARAR